MSPNLGENLLIAVGNDTQDIISLSRAKNESIQRLQPQSFALALVVLVLRRFQFVATALIVLDSVSHSCVVSRLGIHIELHDQVDDISKVMNYSGYTLFLLLI